MISEKLYQILLFIIVLLVGATFVDFFHLIPAILTQWQLMEPAENENLVLTWAISNGYAVISSHLIEHGVLPIYPDFYHRFSSMILLGPQFGGRLSSVVAYIGISVGVLFFAKKRTESWIAASLFAVVLFGHPTHSIYFLMQRTDGMFIAFGVASLLIAWWDIGNDAYVSAGLKQLSLWRCLFAGLTLGMSLLTKQTAIVFILLHFVPFAATWVVESRLISVSKLVVIGCTTIITIVLYALIVNHTVIDDYLFGLKIYGNASWLITDALNKQEVHFFKADHYYLYVVGFLSAVFMNIKVKDITHFVFVFGVATLATLVTLKLWTNDAAFSNNFIFISVFGVFLTLYLWPKEGKVKKCILIGPFLMFGVLSYIGSNENQLDLFKSLQSTLYNGSYRYQFADKMVAASKEDPILAYIKSNPGHYITTRLDNYLITVGRDVEFEGSVMGGFAYGGDQISRYTKDEKRVDEVKLLIKNLHDKIGQKYFQGIVLGLANKSFISEFPELLVNYYPLESREITQGNFTFTAVLYTKKD